jgi:alpha-beta hydrolase superfamily lysophospholipase
MQTKTAAQLLVIALAASHLLAKDEEHTMEHPTSYRTIQVDGLSVFYREAGPTEAPTILLLHGLPTSSRQFEPLFARLADRYHLVAPDYPGFGHSERKGVRAYYRHSTESCIVRNFGGKRKNRC